MEGCRTISVRDLIRSSLRMRPDRIIVGEVRGAEICELLTAYNSGHAGSMSTGHGNTARDMLLRMETMLLMGMDIPLSAIRRQIASGIDILVHLGRMRDKPERYWKSQKLQDFRKGRLRPGRCMPLKRTKTVRGKRSAANWKRKENFVMWKSWKRRALAENKTDYSKYRFSWQEYLLCFSKHFCDRRFYRDVLPVMAWNAGVSGSMEGFIRTRQKEQNSKKKGKTLSAI